VVRIQQPLVHIRLFLGGGGEGLISQAIKLNKWVGSGLYKTSYRRKGIYICSTHVKMWSTGVLIDKVPSKRHPSLTMATIIFL
jgi:hypothetical protein